MERPQRTCLLYCAYHGTPAANLSSILQHGLRPSKDGSAGPGLYITPSPLYAQLYSSGSFHCSQPATWKCPATGVTYYVDVLLLVRFPDLASSIYNSGVDEIAATIGADYCLERLFSGARLPYGPKQSGESHARLEDQLICCVPLAVLQKHDVVKIQAVVVKLHKVDPYGAGGEWEKIKELVVKASKA